MSRRQRLRQYIQNCVGKYSGSSDLQYRVFLVAWPTQEFALVDVSSCVGQDSNNHLSEYWAKASRRIYSVLNQLVASNPAPLTHEAWGGMWLVDFNTHNKGDVGAFGTIFPERL